MKLLIMAVVSVISGQQLQSQALNARHLKSIFFRVFLRIGLVHSLYCRKVEFLLQKQLPSQFAQSKGKKLTISPFLWMLTPQIWASSQLSALCPWMESGCPFPMLGSLTQLLLNSPCAPSPFISILLPQQHPKKRLRKIVFTSNLSQSSFLL